MVHESSCLAISLGVFSWKDYTQTNHTIIHSTPRDMQQRIKNKAEIKRLTFRVLIALMYGRHSQKYCHHISTTAGL